MFFKRKERLSYFYDALSKRFHHREKRFFEINVAAKRIRDIDSTNIIDIISLSR